MSVITKKLAVKIADKLGAEYTEKARHTWVVIKHNKIIVAQFGIRRGSDNDLGHGHVPSQIHLPQQKALKLGICTMTQQQWIEEMKRQGFIAAS
jgi:hypothetical protein